LETLEATVDTKFDLHGGREGIRRFDTSRLELVKGLYEQEGVPGSLGLRLSGCVDKSAQLGDMSNWKDYLDDSP
jgi:hypothetical protein